jgi:spore germination cell wall hydrolase CwlJ-like protein
VKLPVAAGAVALFLLVATARAQGEGAPAPAAPAEAAKADWSEWTRPLQPRVDGPAGATPALPSAETAAAPEPAVPAKEIDVVDAHWMALTMWGEARSGGEEAMRAVGHVIENRRRTGTHGRYATQTVSAAWQFSCWNRGDPNYSAMMRIDDLPADSRDRAMWVAARRLADEILSGASADPTGGALFYHTAAVSPRWSAGLPPIRIIGGHLFFRTAR